ncbi:ActS/PrrB/RegB family redox-sensitive histidine kinase [Methylocella sp.]|jgi:two-component system sensor histidine kinase RegB|uniref:ActS/PrrB/RegB family redox-sensitive histidine kinase n=1 Tax=Methylocella sp. TaxID=1978226 RepID=UPI003C1D8FA5
MVELLDLDLGRHSRRLHVDTLVRLRWLALFGQTAALLFTYFVLGFSLPLGLCLMVIAMSAALNIGLRITYGRVDQLNELPAAAVLAFDIIQLTALLYLTGGIENPFSMLFLAPIMISAVSLGGWITLSLTALMIAAASLLTVAHHPLPWFAGQTLELPLIYAAGLWTAHVVSASFIAIYLWLVALEARKLAEALTATELVLAREQHLTQLDGLAAAAAHELGTPLATVTLVVRDLEKQIPATDPLAEDVALLAQQVARCRNILGKLTSLGGDAGDILDEMTLSLMIEEVVGPQRDFGVKITIVENGEGRQPVARRNPGILYGLGNLIENAIDFAASEVRIAACWNASSVKLVIEDDGPGFSPDVIGRIGAPYVTTKTHRRAKSEDGAGLGLGLFIAKTLLERSGAFVATANVSPPKSGARITIVWQRAVFERGAAIQKPAALTVES